MGRGGQEGATPVIVALVRVAVEEMETTLSVLEAGVQGSPCKAK